MRSNNVSQTVDDTDQVLNTGGVDAALCSGGNESISWTQVYPVALTPANTYSGANPASKTVKTCNSGEPVNCGTGDFWLSGPTTPKVLVIQPCICRTWRVHCSMRGWFLWRVPRNHGFSSSSRATFRPTLQRSYWENSR